MSDDERELIAQAFELAGCRVLHSRHSEEAKVLEAYRRELESELDHVPTPADLALIDSARRSRGLILILTRRCFNDGITTGKGNVREVVKDLRAWIRLEADLLSRLSFKHEPRAAADLRDTWREAEKGAEPPATEGAP